MSYKKIKDIDTKEYIYNLSQTELKYSNSKDDRQLFFEYKKYILLYGVIDVSDINDEDSVNTIIKNSRLKSSFHWYKFQRVLGLYYANQYYDEVLYKLKQYDYPIYEQVYQIKQCYDVLSIKIINKTFRENEEYLISPVFYKMAFKKVYNRYTMMNFIEQYLKIPLEVIYKNLLEMEIPEETAKEYIYRIANKEIKQRREDYNIQLEIKLKNTANNNIE